MAKQPETYFKEKCLSELKKIHGVWAIKVQMVALLGIPDIILCVNGRFGAWELKKDGKEKPTKLQIYNLNKIKQCGGIAERVHPGNFEEKLQDILNITPGKEVPGAQSLK